TLPGKLVVNTDQQAHISPNFSGHVEQVNVALGQYVERGQTLAVLSVPELIDQQASLSIAQSSLRLAQQEYEREQQLWSQGISAKQDLQRAENAYRQAQITVQSQQARLHALGSTGQNGRFVIRAPIPGMISQKDIVVGENVQLADQLFVIENLKDLWLEFNLPNTSNIQLQAGQILNFKTNGSDQNYQAKVQTLNSQADLQTGRLQVRAKVTTQADVLRPNVLVNVFVTDAQAKTALRVQKKALQQVEGKP
ncbi:MAG: efflux RND transporter periplasmic adaptor subunit, partial [Acinetobacter sp.]